jgi:hypothetical protein
MKWLHFKIKQQIYREDFNEVHVFMALRFIATRASPAAKCTRILSMTQHANNIRNEGKFLPLFTDHRRCWNCCPSTRIHSSHRQKRFRFTFWKFSAVIFEISLQMFSLSSSVRGLLLAPMLSIFSSVSTRHLCFVFLSIKSPVVLSLFTKLWIVYLLETLSSWNLRQNFRQHFPADPYFT